MFNVLCGNLNNGEIKMMESFNNVDDAITFVSFMRLFACVDEMPTCEIVPDTIWAFGEDFVIAIIEED